MNKDEMIKEMADRMDDYCQSTQECPHFRLEDEDYEITCSICRARSLYNAGYRKVGEDEVVLKQSEVDEFRKDHAEVKFLKNKIKQETAREILQEIFTLLHTIKGQDYEDGIPYYCEEVEIFNDRLSEIFNKYGIELE